MVRLPAGQGVGRGPWGGEQAASRGHAKARCSKVHAGPEKRGFWAKRHAALIRLLPLPPPLLPGLIVAIGKRLQSPPQGGGSPTDTLAAAPSSTHPPSCPPSDPPSQPPTERLEHVVADVVGPAQRQPLTLHLHKAGRAAAVAHVAAAGALWCSARQEAGGKDVRMLLRSFTSLPSVGLHCLHLPLGAAATGPESKFLAI